MTNDEAIELLSHLFMLRTLSDMADDYNEALCMAIDALNRKEMKQPDMAKYLQTVARLQRGRKDRLSDADVICELADEIERYRDKIKAMEEYHRVLNDAEIYLSPGMVWNTDEEQIEELVRAELSERIARKLTKGKAIKKRLDTVSGMYVYSFGKEEHGDNDKQ